MLASSGAAALCFPSGAVLDARRLLPREATESLSSMPEASPPAGTGCDIKTSDIGASPARKAGMGKNSPCLPKPSTQKLCAFRSCRCQVARLFDGCPNVQSRATVPASSTLPLASGFRVQGL